MANRAHHEPGAGWRAVFDPGLWRQGLIAATAGAVSMALVACAVALVRDTTGHDWYAAYRITLADVTIGVGFDEDAPVEYRNADGEVESVSRFRLTHRLEARWAREGVLEAAWNGATLGALSGFGGALLCLVLIRRSLNDLRARRPGHDPALSPRPEARDRAAPAPERSMAAPARIMPASSGSSPTTAAPPPAPANRLPASEPRPAARSEPTAARPDKAESDKDIAKPPARREGARRDHGRWV